MKKYFVLLALQACFSLLNAQNIAINTTGAAPDSSAALDITSTSSGLLAPRMTTTQMNAITRPAQGLMIFNTTVGSFQVNVGSTTTPNWVKVIYNTSIRDNHVIVKTISDFPAPVSGTITLASGILYEVNGTISTPNKIDLNNGTLRGADPGNDKLIYTGTSGGFFTGANGGLIRDLTLTASGTGGKLFNLNASGAVKNLTVRNCTITGCDNVGTIQGFGGNTYLEALTFSGNNNGVVFTDDNNVILNTNTWDNTNKNTYEKFTGTFTNIQIVSGLRSTTSGNSAVGLDISGITSLTTGSLRSSIYTGTGTKVNGTFSSAWDVSSSGLTAESDDNAYGSIYISSSTATPLATANVPLKAYGTTSAETLQRFTMPTDNRLTYTGTKTRVFQVTATFSTLAEADGKFYSMYIYKNGSAIGGSRQKSKQQKGNEPNSIALSCNVSLATNDYIEVWIENNSDNKNFTVDQMNLSIK
jgi:hypothetical protein